MVRGYICGAGLGLLLSTAPAGAQTLHCPQTLNFGRLAACTGAQTATLTPQGSLSTSGCLTALGNHNVGRCSLSDLTDTATITIDPMTQLDGPGSQQMNIDNFMLRPVSGGIADSALIVTADEALPSFDFTIGGTLHINSTQPGGHYDGLYSVTVNYE